MVDGWGVGVMGIDVKELWAVVVGCWFLALV